MKYLRLVCGAGLGGSSTKGDRPKPPPAATTAGEGRGKVLTTDGPFAETKEWLGVTGASRRRPLPSPRLQEQAWC